MLIAVVAAMSSKAAGFVPPGFGPYLVGMLVWAIGLSLGGTTGYAINPARDFGPRLMHAILPIAGKGGSNWPYAPVPILGPPTGAARRRRLHQARRILVIGASASAPGAKNFLDDPRFLLHDVAGHATRPNPSRGPQPLEHQLMEIL